MSFLVKIFQGDWIRKRFESPGIVSLDAEDKKTCLRRLIRSTGYDIKSLTACNQYCIKPARNEGDSLPCI